jgi:hypothetical protein
MVVLPAKLGEAVGAGVLPDVYAEDEAYPEANPEV